MGTLKRLGKSVKDAWHIIGIVILLLCLLEGGLSIAFRIKDRLRSSPPAMAHPFEAADIYSDPAWAHSYYTEFERTGSQRAGNLQWHSYIYWRRKPFAGSYINIDTDGIRQTTMPDPRQAAAGTALKVFMFGGSTMWGVGVSDAATIPSILAKELEREGVVAEIVNFGESGYVSTQEVIALMLQLQKGHIPDLVIFYDGVNDTYSAYQHQVAGLPQNEFNRVKEFNLSSAGASEQRRDMVIRDVLPKLATLRFAKGLLQRLGIRRREVLVTNPVPGMTEADTQVLAQALINTYTNNRELVAALSKHYRFEYLFYWQPTIFQKASLTNYELGQREAAQNLEPLFRKTYDLMQQSARVPQREPPVRDLSLLLTDVANPMYVDWNHVGEAGNKFIAQRMAQDVLKVVRTKAVAQ
jgi:lysophospholipase L1-like esterase